MKIDLDDLEHDCMGAPVLGCPADHPMCMPPYACAAMTLALIARIRELEAAGRTLAERARFRIDDDRKIAEYDAAVEILEKGVVLP